MSLRDQILAFDPEVPVERAHTPPVSWYTEPAFDALERTAIFRSTWQYACRVDQVAQPGAFVAGRLAGLPWVVVRGEDGLLRAFANTCRHKATEVCTGEGTATQLVCPYHGWTYRLDGALRSAPRIAGIEDFDRDELALPPLGVTTLGPLVLIHADPTAAPPRFSGLAGLVDGWRGLVWQARRRYDVAANWKAFCDNYLDGGYHIAHLHPGLAEQLDLESYQTRVHDDWSLQTCEPSADRADRTTGGAQYVWVYPNLMLNRYGPCLDLNVVHPAGPGRCTVTFDFWFEPETDLAWRRASIEDSERTQLEDMGISERVQVGMESGTWSRGRYAPRVEVGIHHFHRLVAADLRKSVAR